MSGGLTVALVVVALYWPHAFWLDHADPGSAVQKSLEIAFYGVLGLLSGWIASRAARERRRLEALTGELRQSLAAIEAKDAQLARADRLQALGELTGGLAHEIRNPLHAMRGTAEVLLAAVPAGSEEYAIGTGLLEEVDRLDRVLGRFLDYARERPADRVPVDLAEVVTRVEALLRAQAARQDTAIEVLASSNLAKGDLDQLVQVVLGLGLNALAALEQGGQITLAALRREGQVGLAVINDGPPIPEDLLPRVFDPFVSGSDHGTGLGLSVAWRLIDAHGGSIEVENLLGGKGVAFRIWLPLG
jgi:signal transduction histidine kinase